MDLSQSGHGPIKVKLDLYFHDIFRFQDFLWADKFPISSKYAQQMNWVSSTLDRNSNSTSLIVVKNIKLIPDYWSNWLSAWLSFLRGSLFDWNIASTMWMQIQTCKRSNDLHRQIFQNEEKTYSLHESPIIISNSFCHVFDIWHVDVDVNVRLNTKPPKMNLALSNRTDRRQWFSFYKNTFELTPEDYQRVSKLLTFFDSVSIKTLNCCGKFSEKGEWYPILARGRG